MSRPHNTRKIHRELAHHRFKPAGVPSTELPIVKLTLDEAEAIALADLEGLYQEAAARELEVSRATFGRILASAHAKIADAIINGKLLLIEGGAVETCQKRRQAMKVAIAVNENQIEDHFGQCRKIRVFTVIPGQAEPSASDFPLPAEMGCRSGLAPLLARSGVTHVIAARMGGGVRSAFESQGVTVIAGVTGDVSAAVTALAMGRLSEGTATCEGHDGGHEHGHHQDGTSGGCCHG
jgi:predicted DNA-binding protein (UPF0251 family)/predicted Fe-Mo cluster-binding NifX family protein